MKDLNYLVSDYYATGEGRTISIMITRLIPKDDEWKNPPTYTYKYYPGELRVSVEDVLKRQFSEQFGEYMAVGMEIIPERDFKEKYQKYVPELVMKMLKEESGNFHYYSQFHINFA